tara:strand:+ start:850 stop:1299 length:450 start_codon:yes stop_codon:yes gene_type:complete
MKYFAYGANISTAGMARRCPRAFPLTRAELPDHELQFYGVATVEPKDGASVQGALWEITTSDLANLDKFEGYPTLYRRGWITVMAHTVDGYPPSPVQALCYFMNLTSHSVQSPPSDLYLNIILEGYEDFELDNSVLQSYTENVGSLLKS